MLKDLRLHGAITPEIDFYAVLAGERLLVTHFYESVDDASGLGINFFLAGHNFHLDRQGLTFSGTGGGVSEYMFGSPMPLTDLAHKEVANRLLFFGAVPGEGGGLLFTPNVSGTVSWQDLFLEGNALSNCFFLLKVPWPYSVRRTQEVLLKTLGRMLKRSPSPGAGDDSRLADEILKELAEPDATLLLLRLAHRPHQQFYDFVRRFYHKEGEWGPPQEAFVSKLADEIGVEQYQRERIAIDILYKASRNRPILDEYKDILLGATGRSLTAAELARLNALRNTALRHGLPPTLFDTLDELLPSAAGRAEPPYLHTVREILHEKLLGGSPREAIGPAEMAQLLAAKQMAQHNHDSGFEQVLLDTGRMLDERAAESEDFEPFEVFSEMVTYFDRLDNAEAVVNQLVFMEHASISEEKVRSLQGNQQAFEELEPGLFQRLVVEPALKNPYALQYGKRKLSALMAGLQMVTHGDQTPAQVAARVDRLATEEHLHQHLYNGVRKRLRQFYYDLANPSHVRLLQVDMEAEATRRRIWPDPELPPGAFVLALEQVQQETEYLNSVYPRLLGGGDPQAREQFLQSSNLDRYHLEDLEREYRIARGLETPAAETTGLLAD